MTTPVAEKLLTVEEYVLLPDPPGMQTELVRGKVVCMPPAKTDHGHYGSTIGFHLRFFSSQHGLGWVTGEGGYVLSRDPDTVRAPDAAFISKTRLPEGLPHGAYVEGAPNLAAEVVSPDDRDSEVANKIGQWLEAGAERVWEVRPRTRTVTVHRSDGPGETLRDNDILTSAHAAFMVDGFELPISELFGGVAGT